MRLGGRKAISAVSGEKVGNCCVFAAVVTTGRNLSGGPVLPWVSLLWSAFVVPLESACDNLLLQVFRGSMMSGQASRVDERMRRGLLLHPSSVRSDHGELVGRDPRTVPAADWQAAGIEPSSRAKAMRAKCVDCCGGSYSEVAKCVSVSCALWPFRMGVYPSALRSLRRDFSPDFGGDFSEDGGQASVPWVVDSDQETPPGAGFFAEGGDFDCEGKGDGEAG